MGQVCQSWRRRCREINVFSRYEYHMFYVLYPFVTYLLTLPRNCQESEIRVTFRVLARSGMEPIELLYEEKPVAEWFLRRLRI
jgi:hypothetical protein